MLRSNLCLQGIWLLGTKCRVDRNAQNTSSPCSICRYLLLLFPSPLHQISPSTFSECALQDSRVLLLYSFCTYWSAQRGRVLHLKEDVLFWRHQWLYLKACTVIQWVFCALSLHAIVAVAVRDFRHTIHFFNVSRETHRLQDKKAFQTELWPGVQPTVYTVGLIHMWHHRLLIFLSLRLGC